jgi:hypothetical protein
MGDHPIARRPGIAGPECPVSSCDFEKLTGDLMCRDHWAMVPKAIRDRAWKYWNARQKGDRAAIALHREACRDAIAAVDAQERG